MTQIDSGQLLALFSSPSSKQGATNNSQGFAQLMALTDISASLAKPTVPASRKEQPSANREQPVVQRQPLAATRQGLSSTSTELRSELRSAERLEPQRVQELKDSSFAEWTASLEAELLIDDPVAEPLFALDSLVQAQQSIMAQQVLDEDQDKLDAVSLDELQGSESSGFSFGLTGQDLQPESEMETATNAGFRQLSQAELTQATKQPFLAEDLEPELDTDALLTEEAEDPEALNLQQETSPAATKVKAKLSPEFGVASGQTESRPNQSAVIQGMTNSEQRGLTQSQLAQHNTQLRTLLTPEQLAERMQQRVMLMVGQKLQQAFIRLDPPELGKLEIQIQKQDERIQLVVVTQTPQARELLEQQLPRLRELLAQQGMDLAGFDARDSEQQQHQPFAGISEAEESEQELVQENIQISTALVDQYV